MKTKVSLMTSDKVSTSDLNVDTVNGIVTLHGKVATEAEKAEAARIAGGIDGAKEVKNLLQVVPESQRKVVERSDDQIKAGRRGSIQRQRPGQGQRHQGRVREQGRRASVGQDRVDRRAPRIGAGGRRG